MDDEKKSMIPVGVIKRIIAAKVKEKNCEMGSDYILKLSKSISQYMVELTNAVCNKAIAGKRKRVTADDLRMVASEMQNVKQVIGNPDLVVDFKVEG